MIAMTNKIDKFDVHLVAERLNITLTDQQLDRVLELYEEYEDNDPTATWDLIVENIVYNIIKL
jgi:hypothetical protein